MSTSIWDNASAQRRRHIAIRVAKRKIRSCDVEDLAQETLLKFYENYAPSDERDNPQVESGEQKETALLATITRSISIDWWRHEKHAPGSLPEAEYPQTDDLDRRDLPAMVSSAVSKLELGEREVVRLRYWEGMAIGEIASQLGLSYSATAKRLSRARRRLRDLLDGEREY